MKQKINWLQKAIIYHIYPRSFYDSNSDGIGDLQGITQKLDYLQDLGINTIWFSPIHTSPMHDMGYDIADYKNIDPIFGSLTDFKNLLSELHKKDIKLLMDFVPNHTSTEHVWFQEAKKSRDNPFRDFYIWKNPKNGKEPNNWLSVFGGSSWEFDAVTEQYYYHSFAKEQPDLNWRNPRVVREMLDVLRFWLDLGIDGFRVDAPEWLFKDERYWDEPPDPTYDSEGSQFYHSLIHTYTIALPESGKMIKTFFEVLEEYKNKFMVTEAWAPVNEIIKMYEVVGKDFYAPFNFGLITLPWNAAVHKKYIDEYDHAVGLLYLPTYVLGNHDKSRIATRVGREQARVAAMLLLTLRGIPFMYYGDELGMANVSIPQNKVQDTFEKNSPRLGLNRDPQRTPMQWDTQRYAGFSKSEPWLPVAADFAIYNVETETKNSTSFLSLYKRLIELRRQYPALTYGEYTSLEGSTESVFIYSRSFASDVLLIILNYSPDEQQVRLELTLTAKILCTTYMDKTDTELHVEHIILRPHEGIILQM